MDLDRLLAEFQAFKRKYEPMLEEAKKSYDAYKAQDGAVDAAVEQGSVERPPNPGASVGGLPRPEMGPQTEPAPGGILSRAPVAGGPSKVPRAPTPGEEMVFQQPLPPPAHEPPPEAGGRGKKK